MTEKEFLEDVSYEINEYKTEMSVFYKFQLVNTISFNDVKDKLNNDEYCRNLAEEVALQSNFGELVKYPTEKNYDNFESCRGYEE